MSYQAKQLRPHTPITTEAEAKRLLEQALGYASPMLRLVAVQIEGYYVFAQELTPKDVAHRLAFLFCEIDAPYARFYVVTGDTAIYSLTWND